MIIILKPDLPTVGPELKAILARVEPMDGIEAKVYSYDGQNHGLTEIHLVGDTARVSEHLFEEMAGVARVVRVSAKYRLVGRHEDVVDGVGFEYKGLRFDQDALHIFPGLCAVDTPEHVDQTFAAIAAAGVPTARMGAYKPRTSPYDFQGHGGQCLPYVFEMAAKHGIRIIAMEVLHASHIEEISAGLEEVGNEVGVMLQIGTRNAQNFELLREVGKHREFPVLYKRGMGNTLDEALNACEYIADSGNRHIVFCLRGVKSHMAEPHHRNFVDFAQVPIIKRLTRLPVCVDPSHSAGRRSLAPDGLTDIHHVTAQGVIAGANMILVDFHPNPSVALCDGLQALTLEELPFYLEDICLVREAYLGRRALLEDHSKTRASNG